jgi:branched-chain amino acid transport system substrate-binding protein
MRWKSVLTGIAAFGLVLPACQRKTMDLPIGVLAELTGDYPVIGASSKKGAELAISQIDEAGGVKVAGKLYGMRLLIEDTTGKPSQAAEGAKRLIETEKVLAIIGPNISGSALPAAEVAENGKTILLTPSATSPRVTIDPATNTPRKYVYRACFTDSLQGRVLAKFATDFMKKQSAAVLFDTETETPKEQAERFQKRFEEHGGKVVFFEGYKKGEKDFSAYIARIKEANADFLFLPNYYADVTEQVKQVRQAGLKIPFLGSDDWSAPNLMATGGQDIEGAYHSGHYAPDQKVPSIAAFVELFKKRHAGEVPDDVAALTYDATMLLRQVLSTATAPDREAIRDAFSRLTTYEGITGKMVFKPGSGDPEKTAIMVKIEGGKRIFVTSIEP